MTSVRQIEANRRNGLKSTGPSTSAGKDRSRRNALRHGLTAETVVTAIEDVDDYRAFESSVVADHDAETAVERELVLRLASLLWRLRRATSIETGLLQTCAELTLKNDDSSQLSFAGYGPSPFGSREAITQSFAHLTTAESNAFERVRRYETTLWRQLRQTLFTLKLLSWQHRTPSTTRAHRKWRNLVDPSGD